MIVCGQQATHASCGDYLLMDDHAQAASMRVDSLEAKLASSTLPPKPCQGPGCQQAPAESLQGVPMPVSQRLNDLSVGLSTSSTLRADQDAITGLLAKRVSLSSGFPEGVFRPPVKGD